MTCNSDLAVRPRTTTGGSRLGMLCCLFGSVAFAANGVQAQETPPKGLARAVAPAWPPPFMQQLPADYLDRLRASLVAGTKRLSRLHYSDTKSTDSIGWVRYGMPSLILGERVGEINEFFESDKFVVSANPKFGFGLFGVSYLRMYGLMNQGLHHARCRECAGDSARQSGCRL